ncbi:zinc finger protein 696-like [Neomonachus schauinslandi]|uniref:Zinc finger protein 696-like n=1 Tax=Neomonachus schauinslandi TaxID=29088 RepID=A0A2Y9H368_NEOSC|nr:zinc finger protein 696-like [Neomonachus schauinslandi]
MPPAPLAEAAAARPPPTPGAHGLPKPLTLPALPRGESGERGAGNAGGGRTRGPASRHSARGRGARTPPSPEPAPDAPTHPPRRPPEARNARQNRKRAFDARSRSVSQTSGCSGRLGGSAVSVVPSLAARALENGRGRSNLTVVVGAGLKSFRGWHGSPTAESQGTCGLGFRTIPPAPHTVQKRFRSGECGRAFRRGSGPAQHCRTGVGKWSFACGACGKALRQGSQLTRLRRTHTGERPCWCSTCGTGFSRRATLRRHQSVHAASGPSAAAPSP